MTTYYKTLLNGRSFHGGEFEWSLPKNSKPGKWHKHTGRLKICGAGFHITSQPVNWWHRDAKCYEVEYRGEELTGGDDKICVSEVRLIRELSRDELVQFQIFYDGEHEVRQGWALASGSAQVYASGSAQVYASGSARVDAYDSARVDAYDSAVVTRLR